MTYKLTASWKRCLLSCQVRQLSQNSFLFCFLMSQQARSSSSKVCFSSVAWWHTSCILSHVALPRPTIKASVCCALRRASGSTTVGVCLCVRRHSCPWVVRYLVIFCACFRYQALTYKFGFPGARIRWWIRIRFRFGWVGVVHYEALPFLRIRTRNSRFRWATPTLIADFGICVKFWSYQGFSRPKVDISTPN